MDLSSDSDCEEQLNGLLNPTDKAPAQQPLAHIQSSKKVKSGPYLKRGPSSCANRSCAETTKKKAVWTNDDKRLVAIEWKLKLEREDNMTHEGKNEPLYVIGALLCENNGHHFTIAQLTTKTNSMKQKFNKINSAIVKGTGGAGPDEIIPQMCAKFHMEKSIFLLMRDACEGREKTTPKLRYDSAVRDCFMVKSEENPISVEEITIKGPSKLAIP